ncbi:MAG: hypothetical protein VX640_12215 [Pseudomonadota bacterium]|nr:hypothetical protein [Pseudomonadota bacterium]
MARFAVQSSRWRAKSIVAFIALFILLVLCSQWCVRAVATAGHLASAIQTRPAASLTAAANAQNAFLRARNLRLSIDRNEGATAEGSPSFSDAERRIVSELANAARETSSPDALALISSIRLSLKKWRDEQPLPEAYGVFADAMEEARAAEIDRQFSLLVDVIAADAETDGEIIRAEIAKRRNEAFLWAVGAPAAAIVLLLTLIRGASPAEGSGAKAAGVIILDPDARIVYADEAAASCVARARGSSDRTGLMEALENAVFEFRNGESSGESLIAGLESGDDITFPDGRSMRVSRHGAEGGGAVVVIADLKAFAPAAVAE